MSLLKAIADATLETAYMAAPFLLFGLVVAGFIHILLPKAVVQRFLGQPGMKGVAWAAFLGIPLPVCSCGVVPISVEMRRKGASRPASLSFLVTTPESSVDSILFTWGLMGPVMAVARPVAAFMTALIGGAWANWGLRDEPDGGAETENLEAACVDSCCGEDHQGHAAHDHGTHTTQEHSGGLWQRTIRPALRYAFVELLDDLAFWLVLGLVLAGLITALLPADLASYGLGGGILPMLLMLVIGLPLYMCASASTPVAAALLAKGLSPGAALVFLLTGPATNAAALVVLTRTFGRRFVSIYLGSVVLGALLCGLLLDVLVAGLVLAPGAGLADDSLYAPVAWFCLAVLGIALLGSFRRGAGATGWRELRQSFSRPRSPIAAG